MRNLFSLFFISLILHSGIIAQEISFNVLQGGKNIGYIKINRSNEKKFDRYTYESDFTLNKGIDIRIQDKIEAVFTNDTLTETNIKSDLNSSNRFNISQKYNRKNNIWIRTVNQKENSEPFEAFSFSFIRLFWEAPPLISDIYSELFHLKFKVSVNKNVVTITDNRNRVQKFTYDTNGKLEKANLTNAIDSYEVVIKK